MTPGERAALVARYREGHALVVAALESIEADELDWRAAPGEWSVREIVHHLADADTIAAARLRVLLTEETPPIPAYDEQVLARRLAYAARAVEPALDAIAAVRATSAQILDTLVEADWQRAGVHSEMGAYSVERWLAFNAAHAADHAAQIRETRAARRG